jgi:hypothetical protein
MNGENLPTCPFCEKKITGIEWFNEELSHIIVFLCPHCRKILSVQKMPDPGLSVPAEPIIPKQSEIL